MEGGLGHDKLGPLSSVAPAGFPVRIGLPGSIGYQSGR